MTNYRLWMKKKGQVDRAYNRYRTLVTEAKVLFAQLETEFEAPYRMEARAIREALVSYDQSMEEQRKAAQAKER